MTPDERGRGLLLSAAVERTNSRAVVSVAIDGARDSIGVGPEVEMSVHRVVCPECKYELLYATLGSKGSYKTGPSFGQACLHAGAIQPGDALSCPVMRAAAETAFRARFPGREVAR